LLRQCLAVLWAILGSKIGGCEAAYRFGGGATFDCVRFGQCIRVVSVLEMNGVQLLVKNLPRKQKKRGGVGTCVWGRQKLPDHRAKMLSLCVLKKNDDDVYFLQFVRKNLKNLLGLLRTALRNSRVRRANQD
jgi:hypothetical protein